jgi:hypothetical protein
MEERLHSDSSPGDDAYSGKGVSRRAFLVSGLAAAAVAVKPGLAAAQETIPTKTQIIDQLTRRPELHAPHGR